MDGPGSRVLSIESLFTFRVALNDADKVFDEVVPRVGY